MQTELVEGPARPSRRQTALGSAPLRRDHLCQSKRVGSCQACCPTSGRTSVSFGGRTRRSVSRDRGVPIAGLVGFHVSLSNSDQTPYPNVAEGASGDQAVDVTRRARPAARNLRDGHGRRFERVECVAQNVLSPRLA